MAAHPPSQQQDRGFHLGGIWVQTRQSCSRRARFPTLTCAGQGTEHWTLLLLQTRVLLSIHGTKSFRGDQIFCCNTGRPQNKYRSCECTARGRVRPTGSLWGAARATRHSPGSPTSLRSIPKSGKGCPTLYHFSLLPAVILILTLHTLSNKRRASTR